MVSGISHLTFMVKDLNRTEEILLKVLGATKVYDSGQETFSVAKERFFLIGHEVPVWVAIMEGNSLDAQTYNHVAFKIDETDYEKSLEAIQALGLVIKPGRPRVPGEGQSIYFYDEDNHLFELHTGTLEERLKRYGVV